LSFAEWTTGRFGQRDDLVDPAREHTMDQSTDANGSHFERESARQHLEIARTELGLLDAVAGTTVGGTPGVFNALVTRRLKTAMHELDETSRLLTSPEDAELPKRIGCPYCGNQIMAKATLCGFCWHKVDTAARTSLGTGT
jgi:hypothetical protein